MKAPTRSPRSLAVLGLLCAGLVASAAPLVPQERAYRGPEGDVLDYSESEILAALKNGEILSQETLGSGTTGVKRLEVEHSGQVVRAVFRHVDVYESNLRMRDGTNYAGFYDRYSAECAAYEMGRLLGLDMIPPAVLRRVSGDRGSVQLWVEDAMTEGDRAEQGLQPPNTAEWRRQQAIMRTFDALIANHDRNTGNSLIDQDWNVWLIDHSRAFQVPRGPASFEGVNQLPRDLWERIRNLDLELVRERLADYLEPAQMRAQIRRHEGLIEHVEELIATRGVEAVLID